MFTTILSLITPTLAKIVETVLANKTLLIMIICALVGAGLFIKGCDYGKALRDDEVAGLQKRLDDLKNAPVSITEHSEPAPIRIAPLRGGGKAVSAPISENQRDAVDSLLKINASLQNAGDALADERDSLRSELVVSRKLNYQLSTPFEGTYRDSTTANDSLIVGYKLWARANPLNQIMGLKSLEYNVTLDDIPWVKRIIEKFQQVELQAEINWWEYALGVLALLGMFFFGRL